MSSISAEQSSGQIDVRSRPDMAALLGIAAVVVFVHVLTNNRYGFHRDELQFLSDARHLDWGFVSYPPVTPFSRADWPWNIRRFAGRPATLLGHRAGLRRFRYRVDGE